jgi:hypothetical protein
MTAYKDSDKRIVSRTCRTRSNAVLLDKKRTKLRREELSGARRSKYRCGAPAAKWPRLGRWDSATTDRKS